MLMQYSDRSKPAVSHLKPFARHTCARFLSFNVYYSFSQHVNELLSSLQPAQPPVRKKNESFLSASENDILKPRTDLKTLSPLFQHFTLKDPMAS
jgi:hypothetical protein